MTYIAIPIAARNVEDAAGMIARAKRAGGELIELRTDYLEELKPAIVEALIEMVRAAGLPMIVTCRDKRQGGAGEWAEDVRLGILLAAIKAGVEFVDCEFENFLKQALGTAIRRALDESATRLIVSEHDFKKPFANIEKLYDEVKAVYPAAIPKLVYTARHINDCFAGFDVLHERDGDAIVLAMGEAGLISRIIARKLGSLVTFVSIDEQTATAPGQITAEAFRSLYRGDTINEHTELYGIIASPVKHSLSPAIHNAGFAAMGMNKLYLPFLVEGGRIEFNAFMDNVTRRAWLDFRGFSVTLPHKENAIEYIQQVGAFIEPLAVEIGAVNTIIVGVNERVNGYNTDYAGAMHAIMSAMGIDKEGLRGLAAAVVGAGGVARAVAAGLVDAGAHVTIYNRTLEKAKGLAHDFSCEYKPLDALASARPKLLVNCTSVGMHPNVDESPVPVEALHKDMVIFDTIYNPAETRLLREARAAGARMIDGTEMFVNQARAQFKLFTGREGDAELMRKTVLDCLYHR